MDGWNGRNGATAGVPRCRKINEGRILFSTSTVTLRETEPAFRYWAFVAMLNAVLLPLAMLLYGEPFRLFEYALSDLGALLTRGGRPNGMALFIFDADMVMSGIAMAGLATEYGERRAVVNRRLKRALSYTASAGFFATTIPHDVLHVAHGFAAGFMVGSLWVLAMAYAAETVRAVGPEFAVLCHGVLHATVITYAIQFAADAPSKQLLQKLAVVGLYTTLLLTSSVLHRCGCRRNEPVDLVWQAGIPRLECLTERT